MMNSPAIMATALIATSDRTRASTSSITELAAWTGSTTYSGPSFSRIGPAAEAGKTSIRSTLPSVEKSFIAPPIDMTTRFPSKTLAGPESSIRPATWTGCTPVGVWMRSGLPIASPWSEAKRRATSRPRSFIRNGLMLPWPSENSRNFGSRTKSTPRTRTGPEFRSGNVALFWRTGAAVTPGTSSIRCSAEIPIPAWRPWETRSSALPAIVRAECSNAWIVLEWATSMET